LEFAGLFALKFDGVNDYLESNASFTQWERTQPWTLFIRSDGWVHNSSFQTIYDTRGQIGSFDRLIIVRFDSNRLDLVFQNSSSPVNRLYVQATINSFNIIQITYSGNSNTSGVNIYVDNVPRSFTIINNNLSSSIINAFNKFRIGRDYFVNERYFKGVLNEVSFINYVKNTSELTADFNSGTQSQGTGSFLLRVIPTFSNNIQTLNPSVPFKELSQNLDMSIFGKTNPMDIDTDFQIITQ
jgi:hypothetical protein